jgi:hypothetical protein
MLLNIPAEQVRTGDLIYHQSESEPLLVALNIPSHEATILQFNDGSKMCLWRWWTMPVERPNELVGDELVSD